MDTKLTLHFDREVIEKAKKYAASQQMSLSRLTEYLYRQITSGDYRTLSEFPVADWVNQVSEGEANYVRRSRKSMKNEFMASKK
jgi:muconolactone delta-isomerase